MTIMKGPNAVFVQSVLGMERGRRGGGPGPASFEPKLEFGSETHRHGFIPAHINCKFQDEPEKLLHDPP